MSICMRVRKKKGIAIPWEGSLTGAILRVPGDKEIDLEIVPGAILIKEEHLAEITTPDTTFGSVMGVLLVDGITYCNIEILNDPTCVRL